MSHEIQSIFRIPAAKEAYYLPGDYDSPMSSFMQGIRAQLRAAGLIPKQGDYSAFDLEGIHDFDVKLREKNDKCEISLAYEAASKGKRRFSDAVS